MAGAWRERRVRPGRPHALLKACNVCRTGRCPFHTYLGSEVVRTTIEVYALVVAIVTVNRRLSLSAAESGSLSLRRDAKLLLRPLHHLFVCDVLRCVCRDVTR